MVTLEREIRGDSKKDSRGASRRMVARQMPYKMKIAVSGVESVVANKGHIKGGQRHSMNSKPQSRKPQ